MGSILIHHAVETNVVRDLIRTAYDLHLTLLKSLSDLCMQIVRSRTSPATVCREASARNPGAVKSGCLL